ncbi:hypothetical protein RYX36_033317, partial [Vicia faba]
RQGTILMSMRKVTFFRKDECGVVALQTHRLNIMVTSKPLYTLNQYMKHKKQNSTSSQYSSI